MMKYMRMKCPFCGEEMERGNLCTQNGIGLLFLPPGEQPSGLFNTARSVEKKGGIALDGPYNVRFSDTRLPAFVCRTCRKLMLDF